MRRARGGILIVFFVYLHKISVHEEHRTNNALHLDSDSVLNLITINYGRRAWGGCVPTALFV